MIPTEAAAGAWAADPLELAAAALDSIAASPLERHPELFTRFDQQLRDALDAPQDNCG